MTLPLLPHPEPAARGFVSLVGAGPGNPDLLTLRGLRRLQAADVILPDALLQSTFADLYPPGALVVPAGKRGGRASTPQARIHTLMIEHARAGARVVRLKNGDPLLFGRGHEEAQALAEAGIPFEFVPGVSALQAGAAAGLRIPAHAHPDSLFEAAPVPGPERFPRLAGGGRTHR